MAVALRFYAFGDGRDALKEREFLEEREEFWVGVSSGGSYGEGVGETEKRRGGKAFDERREKRVDSIEINRGVGGF